MFPPLINDKKITIYDQTIYDKTLKFIDSISLIASKEQTNSMLLNGKSDGRGKKKDWAARGKEIRLSWYRIRTWIARQIRRSSVFALHERIIDYN